MGGFRLSLKNEIYEGVITKDDVPPRQGIASNINKVLFWNLSININVNSSKNVRTSFNFQIY